MKRALVLAVALATGTARAEPPSDETMQRIRQLSEAQDYAGMRRELLAAYAQTQYAPLLFALGQVAYNLRTWQAAIDYYEQFIATEPPEEQVSLAQQGIVAARIEMQRDRDKPPPPAPRRREWRGGDTIFIAASSAVALAGIATFAYGHRMGNDHGGTLADYDRRADRAGTYQWVGGGLIAAGLVTAGITVLRWRLRPDDGELQITATGTGAGVSLTW